MINKESIIISHPTGNTNVRAVAEGLAQAGILHEFFTCVSVRKSGLIYKLGKLCRSTDIQKRVFGPELEPFIRNRPLRELGRLAIQKIGKKNWLPVGSKKFSIDFVYKDLDRFVSKNLENIRAVYAYEDGASYSFERAKSKEIICLYDLPIGYWRAMHQYLETERQERPAWAVTLNCFNDSEAKLERKERELALADFIFVASSFTKKTLQLFPGQLPPIFIVPYGFPQVITERTYENPSNRKLKVLFVGSLSQRKGVANLLESVDALNDQIDLTIIGRKVAEECVPLEKGLLKHHWIPSLPHDKILRIMRTQDLLIFPSLFEGYGLVISESMAQGTPVITTERTCGSDFIKDGINGWLVKAGNTESLTTKLEEIIDNPSCLEIVGKAALATAEELPLSMYSERMVKIINELLT